MIRKKRILLVEDDTTMAVMIREILESGAYQVAQAGDGVSALQFLGVASTQEIKEKTGVEWTAVNNEWTPEGSAPVLPDLVVADCMMPRMDGFTLVTFMGQDEKVRGIPVVVLTTKEKMEEPFLQLGNVKGFLAKPADPDQLLELAGKAMRKS